MAASGYLVLVQDGGYHLSNLGNATLGGTEGVLGLDSDVSDLFRGSMGISSPREPNLRGVYPLRALVGPRKVKRRRGPVAGRLERGRVPSSTSDARR